MNGAFTRFVYHFVFINTILTQLVICGQRTGRPLPFHVCQPLLRSLRLTSSTYFRNYLEQKTVIKVICNNKRYSDRVFIHISDISFYQFLESEVMV